MQVYREWMPVSDEPWKAYPIGTLATLYRTESRLLGRTRPADIGAAFRADDPELKWADTSRRGYLMIDLTPRRVTGEWLFMKTIRTRDLTLSGTHRMHAERGRRAFSA